MRNHFLIIGLASIGLVFWTAFNVSNPMVRHTGTAPSHYNITVDVVFAVLQLTRVVAGIGVYLAVVIAVVGHAMFFPGKQPAESIE